MGRDRVLADIWGCQATAAAADVALIYQLL